jgi:hypothetical protein
MDLRQRKKSVALAHQDKFNLVGGCSTHVVSIKQGSAMASKAPERTKTRGGRRREVSVGEEKEGKRRVARTPEDEQFRELLGGSLCHQEHTPHEDVESEVGRRRAFLQQEVRGDRPGRPAEV